MDAMNMDQERSGGGLSGLLVKLGMVLMVGAVVWFFVQGRGLTAAHGAGDWYHSVDEGLDAAEASGKPILIFFTADWCPPCQQFKGAVLTDAGVEDRLEQFELVKVDMTERGGPNMAVAQEFGVNSIPRLLVYRPDGTYVSETPGVDPVSFSHWLDGCLNAAEGRLPNRR